MAYSRRTGSFRRRGTGTTRRYKRGRTSWTTPFRKGPTFRAGATPNNFTIAKFATRTVSGFLNGTAQSISVVTQPTTGSENVYYIGFSFGDAPTIGSTYANMWDQCKMYGVEINLLPRQTMDTIGLATASVPNQYVWTAVDYDGTGSATTLNQIMNYQGAKQWTPYKPIRFYFKPMAMISRVNAFGSGATNMLIRPGWDANVGNSIPYYGVYLGFPGGIGAAQFAFDLNCIYTVGFKNKIA